MSRSAEIGTRIALTAAIVGGAAIGYSKILKDGQNVSAKNETTCWQCPGGNNLTELQEVSNCSNGQVNRGKVVEGVLGVVDAPDDNTFENKYGYTRVALENTFNMNPPTLDGVNLEPRTCWIKSSDLKKVK